MIALIAVALLAVSGWAQTVAGSVTGGRIQGRVADAGGGAIEATIRVIQPDTGVVVSRVQADRNGSFRTEKLQVGSYTLTAWDKGFRRREIPNIVVQGAAPSDLGDIRLDLWGCDAPEFTCNFVGSVPDSFRAIKSVGYIRLKLTCGADIDGKGEVQCPETPNINKPTLDESVDIRFTADESGLWLLSANGAAMSVPSSSDTVCRDAKYGLSQIRADGLGAGVDFCLRSKRGAVAHLFFTTDIERHSTEITLWQVTRRR